MGTGVSDSIKTAILQLINQRANEILNEDPLISDKNAFGRAAIEIREFIENLLSYSLRLSSNTTLLREAYSTSPPLRMSRTKPINVALTVILPDIPSSIYIFWWPFHPAEFALSGRSIL